MRSRAIPAIAAVFVLACSMVLAQASSEKKETAHKAKAVSGAIVKKMADLKFEELDPKGAPGVKNADLWGDHTKGAFGAISKFPAGWTAPLHTHTHTFKIVVISGTFIHTPEGKPEQRLGPGDYLLQPGGNYRHTTACDKASECVFFIESNGAFDIKPVEAAEKK
jgi:quercetin dioxygenase-like cupin family protein